MEVQAQWADSLLGLERLLFLKIVLWAAFAIMVGTLLLVLGRQRERPLLLEGLGLGLIAPGAAELLLSLLARGGVGLRDLESATSLDRALWVTIGLTSAWASAALFFAVRARLTGPAGSREVGVGIGIAAHGVAIALLSLQLAASLVR